MELMNALTGRRSVRNYLDTPIPRQTLEELLEAACWAPSGVNRQPWYFLALTDPEQIAKMKENLEGIALGIGPLMDRRFPTHPEVKEETVRFVRGLGGAPVYVLVFLQRDYPDREPMMLSAAAAIQSLLLAAWERGIGSCWLYAANEAGYDEKLRELFAPDKGPLVSLVTLGYPAPEPPLRAPARKPGRWDIR